MPDKKDITVSMSLADFEYYRNMEERANTLTRMLERANREGSAVMTDELRTAIEEIYC